MASTSKFKNDPYAALRVAGFRSYLCGNLLATIGMQMLGLAVGWELYLATHSALVLGLAGLCQTLPILLLAIPSGRLVDHFDRKKLLLLDQLLLGLSAAGLGCVSLFQNQIPNWTILRLGNGLLASLAGLFHVFRPEQSHFDAPYVPLMLALLFFNGIVRSINQPVKQALVPQLVPAKTFFNAVGWNTTVVESSNIAGRALAGLLIAAVQLYFPASPAPCALVYFLAALGQLGQWLFLLPVKVTAEPRVWEPLSTRSFFSGVKFVWDTEVILGVITLDLFGVLFGGAIALLPMFAQDILHCGPAGLGWLSAAPGLGACVIGVAWAHFPPLQRAGRTLLLAVAGFGVATIGFGISQNFLLSMICLFFCRSVRQYFRNYPPNPGADNDSRRHTRPGFGGQIVVQFGIQWTGFARIRPYRHHVWPGAFCSGWRRGRDSGGGGSGGMVAASAAVWHAARTRRCGAGW